MKRILVSGGAGFLGSHLCEELLARGHHVLCMDSFPPGQERNIAHLIGNRRFEWACQDSPFPIDVQVDEIYSLAHAAAGPNPFETVRTIRTAKGGTPDLLFSCHLQRQLSVKLARLFHPYGPRMAERDGSVLRDFILQALEGAPLRVPGDGAQTMAFCYVEDLVAGLILLMEAPEEPAGPVNLVAPVAIPLLELAQRIIQQTGSRSAIVPAPQGEDPAAPPAGLDLAQLAPEWAANTPFEIGLQRTIAHFNWIREHERAGRGDDRLGPRKVANG